MSNKPDGGNAFPGRSDAGGMYDMPQYDKGLSIRDWFAGIALQGLIAYGSTAVFGDDKETPETACARHAYKLADAMIKEREK